MTGDLFLLLGFLSLAACGLYLAFVALRTLAGTARTVIALGLSTAGAVGLWGAVDTVLELVERITR